MTAQVTYGGVEVLLRNADPEARVTNFTTSALRQGGGYARLTKVFKEALHTPTRAPYQLLGFEANPDNFNALTLPYAGDNWSAPATSYMWRVQVPCNTLIHGIRIPVQGNDGNGRLRAYLATAIKTSGLSVDECVPSMIIGVTPAYNSLTSFGFMELMFPTPVQVNRGHLYVGLAGAGTPMTFMPSIGSSVYHQYAQNYDVDNMPNVGNLISSGGWGRNIPGMQFILTPEFRFRGDHSEIVDSASMHENWPNTVWTDKDAICVTRFQFTTGGFPHWLWMAGLWTYNQNPARTVIYSDTGTGPGNLLYQGPHEEVSYITRSIENTPSWFPFARGVPNLAPGTFYYIGIMARVVTEEYDEMEMNRYQLSPNWPWPQRTFMVDHPYGDAPAEFPVTDPSYQGGEGGTQARVFLYPFDVPEDAVTYTGGGAARRRPHITVM